MYTPPSNYANYCSIAHFLSYCSVQCLTAGRFCSRDGWIWPWGEMFLFWFLFSQGWGCVTSLLSTWQWSLTFLQLALECGVEWYLALYAVFNPEGDCCAYQTLPVSDFFFPFDLFHCRLEVQPLSLLLMASLGLLLHHPIRTSAGKVWYLHGYSEARARFKLRKNKTEKACVCGSKQHGVLIWSVPFVWLSCFLTLLHWIPLTVWPAVYDIPTLAVILISSLLITCSLM